MVCPFWLYTLVNGHSGNVYIECKVCLYRVRSVYTVRSVSVYSTYSLPPNDQGCLSVEGWYMPSVQACLHCSFACIPVCLSICRVVVYRSCPGSCPSFVSIQVCLSVVARFIYPVQSYVLQLLVFLSLYMNVCLFVFLSICL